jgi:hypothetical protein
MAPLTLLSKPLILIEIVLPDSFLGNNMQFVILDVISDVIYCTHFGDLTLVRLTYPSILGISYIRSYLMKDKLWNYLRHEKKNVNGWLQRIDAEIVGSILTFQRQHNILGSCVEIGVHHTVNHSYLYV